MIDYAQARELVVRTLGPGWRDGTFVLDDRTIVENDDVFVFRVGAREHLIDGDLAYARFGGAVPAVLKAQQTMVWIPEIRLVGLAPTLRVRPNPSPTYP